MILQTHITDNELKTFFEGMGYTCEMVEVPHFRKVTHGADDVDMVPTLCVNICGFILQAENLMNEYIKMMILRPSNSAERNIDQAARNLMRHIQIKINK